MQIPKMIVTDLDHTLLHTNKTISNYSIKVFKKCCKLGIKLVFATARPKRTVTHFTRQLPIDALIVHNGAVVYAGEQTLDSFGIAPDVRDNLLLSLSKDYHHSKLYVEIDDTLYANFDVSTIWGNIEVTITDFTDLPNKPADKIGICISSFEDIERFSKYLPSDLYIEMTEGILGMIMSRSATKWAAIQVVANHFGIQTSKVIAFGDDYNDIEMLRECGIGVAVANAIDEVKEAANYICDTNDNDGVAKWINENIWRVQE